MGLIGISGLAGSGKDTVCNIMIQILKSKHNITFERKAYADVLKERLIIDFGLTYSQLYGDKKEEPDFRYPKPKKEFSTLFDKSYENGSLQKTEYWTPRELMQFVGTDCYKAVDRLFWIKALYKFYSFGTNWIVTDCRFEEEVDAVLERGGIHIAVRRDNNPYVTTKHISENNKIGLYKVDFEINNGGSLSDLQDQIEVLLYNILNKIEDKKNAKYANP